MAEPSSARSILEQRLNDPWLLGLDSPLFWSLVQQAIDNLNRLPSTVRILVADPDPLYFLAGFLAACTVGQPVFLGNANWSSAEWKAAIRLICPDLIWSSENYRCTLDISPFQFERAPDWLDTIPAPIGIPTGGSSGQLRFVVHTWETLLASVRGMQSHFGISDIHSGCVLPLHHVSGLMQAMRSLTTGGTLAIAPSKELATVLPQVLDPTMSFLSLVPTQLQRCLEEPSLIAWFQKVRAILLGGAPAWPALLHHARQLSLPVALTYGMTETASQVATLHPEQFLAGATHVGRSLPHAHLRILDEDDQAVPPGHIGRIHIHAESLAWGYYPGGRWQSRQLVTDDLGVLDGVGNLTIVGRGSDKIITGGENVYPSEVEAAIRATGLVEDVCVLGQPDSIWGEAVTAVYVPKATAEPAQDREWAMGLLLRSQLSPFKIPKHWIAQSTLPRNAQGKLNRAALQQQILSLH